MAKLTPQELTAIIGHVDALTAARAESAAKDAIHNERIAAAEAIELDLSNAKEAMIASENEYNAAETAVETAETAFKTFLDEAFAS